MSGESKTETKLMSCSTTCSNNDVSIQNDNCPNPDNMLSGLLSLDEDNIPVQDEIKEDVSGLDSDNEDENYCVVTSDDIKFILTKEEIVLAKLLETANRNYFKNEDMPLPIPSVHSSVMSKIVVYMKYHSKNPILENNTPDKLTSCSFKENIKCEWDVEFIENTVMGNPETAKDNLYSLIRAANYMDIQPLLQLACTKVASMIKGKSLDKIKDIISTEKPYFKDVE